MSAPLRPGEIGPQVAVDTHVDADRKLGVLQFEFGYLALPSSGLGQMIEMLRRLKAEVDALDG